MSINTNSSVEKVAFELIRNAKSLEFPERNCKIAWDKLVNKYALHTVLSVLTWKSKFHGSSLSQFRKIKISGYLIWKGCEFE